MMMNVTASSRNFSASSIVAAFVDENVTVAFIGENVTTAFVGENVTAEFVCENVTTTRGPLKIISKNDRPSWFTLFQLILILILLVLGLGGNTLTLIVTATRSYRNRAHGIYITAMAVADIIFLLTQPLNRTFVHYLFGVDIRSYSLIGCKIYYFFLHWSRAASSLSVALVCFERFVAVWLPWKANALSKKRVALIEICCIFLLAGSVSGLRTELVGIKNNVCYDVLLTPNNRHLKEIGSTLGMTIRTLIPTLTLLILTPPTVAKLICQRQLKQQMTRSNASNNEDTFRVSLMLLSVVIAFCILVAPFCVIKHVYLFLGVKIATTSDPALKKLFEIGLICEQVNCVINFVLYVLISRMFRQRIVELLKCGRETNNDTPRGIERETLQTFSSMVSNGSLNDLEGKPI